VIGAPRTFVRSDRQGLSLAVVIALACPLRAAPQSDGREPSAAHVDGATFAAIERILTPPATAKRADPQALSAAIVQLGVPAIPVLVALLAGEVDAAWFVQGTLEEPVQPLVLERRSEIQRAALAGLPAAEVLAHVEERLAAGPEMDVRLMLAGVLGRIPRREAFEVLLSLVDGIEPIHLRRSYVQGSVEGPISDHLRGDPGLLKQLDSRAFRADAALLGVYARSVGAVHSARGVELLAGWVGRDSEADAVILSQLGRAAGEGGLAISPEALAVVRRSAVSTDLQVQRAALVALGRLRDGDSFETLVRILEEGASLAATSAQWSLVRLCDVDLGLQAQAWKDWRERETTWWNERAPELIDALHGEQSGVVLQAVAQLVRHPLHRHAVADVLGPMLAHTDEHVARAVCAALASLESSRAVPWLVEALSRPDAELRRLAGAGLTRLTGLALPPDPLVWSKVLAS
jgi:HEAT repeat protein